MGIQNALLLRTRTLRRLFCLQLTVPVCFITHPLGLPMVTGESLFEGHDISSTFYFASLDSALGQK